MNQQGDFISDCLVLGVNGSIGQLNPTTKAYFLCGLSYPIAVHCYGFNSFTLKSKSELVEKIVLTRLSDSLCSVNVISNRISAEESLRKILNNTTARHRPPDTLFQDFTYLLLSATGDTLAFALGLVSRDIGAVWNGKTDIFYDSISALYLDSTQAPLLNKMWGTLFLHTRYNSFMGFLNKKMSRRQELKLSLDSIIKDEDVFTYYFYGTNTYNHLFGAPHTTELWFSGKGASLEDAVLVEFANRSSHDFKGLKSVKTMRIIFNGTLSFFGSGLYQEAYTADDERCPNCVEKLFLSNPRTSLATNKNRFRTGYFNLWQFNHVTTRDSIMPYLLVK